MLYRIRCTCLILNQGLYVKLYSLLFSCTFPMFSRTFCTVKLPVGKANPVARLYLMDKYLKNLKKSTVPIMAFMLMPFVGGLFSWMLRFLIKNRSTTVMFSNMPGPRYEVKDAMGYALKDTMFSVGLGPGTLGKLLIKFTSTSNHMIRFQKLICPELFVEFMCNFCFRRHRIHWS